MLLESGEDVDQNDQVFVFRSLCKSDARGFFHSFLAFVDYEQALVFGFAPSSGWRRLEAIACTKVFEYNCIPCVHERTQHSDWPLVTNR